MSTDPSTSFPKVVGLRGRRSTTFRDDVITGWIYVTPLLLGSAVFVLFPLIATFWYSMNDWQVFTGTFTFTGLDNYARLFADPTFHNSLRVSALFSVGLVTLNVTLALGLALLLNLRLPGTTAYRTFFFSPVVVSLVAWSIVWGFLLQADGGVNAVLNLVGIEGPNWLRDETTALTSVIVVQVFKGVGLNMILFLAALQGVGEDIKEAARLDGAGGARIFRSITIPLISPQILLVLMITIVGSLESFALIAVLTSGGPGDSTNVLVYYLYQQSFEYNDFGYGSTIAVVLFLIVLALTLLQWQGRKKWVTDED